MPLYMGQKCKNVKMVIYNVLFKGVERHVNPQCHAFTTEKAARDFIEAEIPLRGLTIKSTFGWSAGMRHDEPGPDVVGSFDDYRCEDEQGNSYYYVIFVQNLNPKIS